MALFSEWLKREQGIVDPVGLDAAKKRILGENMTPEQIEAKRKDSEALQRGDMSALSRDRELESTTLTGKQSAPGRMPGHEVGSSTKTAADLNDVINQREEKMKQYEREMKQLDEQEGSINQESTNKRKMIDDLLGSINQGTNMEQLRDRFIALAARASTYPTKVRAGKGARSIVTDDRESLLQPENIKRLKDGYGDGSWDQMKTFADSMKILKGAMGDEDWDNVAKRWYGYQSPDIQKVFQSAGDLGNKDGGSTMHFNGFDENGQKIAGKASDIRRTLALAKVFLQQGGLDGYTGRPLEFQHMEPDHIRGFSQKWNGKTPSKEDRLMADHPDNWIWTSTGINNIKSNDAMPDFLDKLGGMKKGKIDSLMSNQTLNLQDEGQRYLTDDTTDFARSFVTPFTDDEGTVNILSDALTQDMIDEKHGQQDTMIKSLQDMGAQVDESRLLTDTFAAGGSIPKSMRLNLSSQNKEKIRERSQTKLGDNAMREMYRLMVGKSPQEQAKLSRAWTRSWDESIQEIQDQFKMSDNGQDFTNPNLVLGDGGVMRGGPSLRKLFGLKIAEILGKDGESIRNQIKVNELFSEFDLETILG